MAAAIIIIVVVIIFILIILSNKNKEISPIDEIKNLKFTNKKYTNSAGQISTLTDSHFAIVEFKETLTKLENGDPYSAWIIGEYYETGNITKMYNDNLFPKNREKAFWWKIKAATDGSPEAQYQLGRMYHIGSKNGFIKSNIKEAVKWYIQAAENGEFFSLIELGALYFYGSGSEIEKDYKKAFEYLTLAVEHKDVKLYGINITVAQVGLYNSALLLGELYALGNGIEQDLIQAYKWCKIGGEDPDTYSKYPLKGKISNDDKLLSDKLIEEWSKRP